MQICFVNSLSIWLIRGEHAFMAISSDIMVPSHAETRILSNGMAITIHLHLAFSYEGHIHHGSFHEYFHMIQLNNNNRLPSTCHMHVYSINVSLDCRKIIDYHLHLTCMYMRKHQVHFWNPRMQKWMQQWFAELYVENFMRNYEYENKVLWMSCSYLKIPPFSCRVIMLCKKIKITRLCNHIDVYCLTSTTILIVLPYH